MSCGDSLAKITRCSGCGADLPAGARFCPGCGQAADPTAAAAAPTERPLAREVEGERRHLTVMFCDLVGSTPLAQRLDPEDVQNVIHAYQAACEVVIRRYDGHIAQYLGDGLLVFFGLPTAHEDDAQRAVRAGLGILEAIRTLNVSLERERGLELAVRIGVHSGPTVVGVTGGESRDSQVFGHTMNLSARLQGVAPVGSMVISDDTLRLVRGLFTVRALGPQPLKGIADPVEAFEVVRATGVGSATESQPGRTPLVGREQELGLLEDRWRQVQEGRGQVVVVSGEAGMGKSRLIEVLRDELADHDHTWLQCRASPYQTHSPLYPVLELVRQGLFIHEEDDAPARTMKLERALGEAGLDLASAVPLFAPLLELPVPAAYPPLGLSADAQRERTLEALARWILTFAEARPVVAVVEDLHWIDPTTLDLLALLAQQVPTAPVLLVLSTRPSAALPFAQRGHVAQLALVPLTRGEVRRMVADMAAGRELPGVVLDQLVAKTDGVPIFVEELTKMVLESGLLERRNGHYELVGPLPPLAIPTTLQDSLMARLDRLAPVKGVAQIAAVLGREFSYELLREVAAIDDATLRDALGQLVEAELLYQRGIGPQASFIFRHALIQESAYASLLNSTRQRVHRDAAEALRNRPSASPELLAYHLEGAGAIALAIDRLAEAGSAATARSAHVESLKLIERALELLEQLPADEARDRRELDLHVRRAVPMIATSGYASDALGELLVRARALAERGEDPAARFSVDRGLAILHATRADYAEAQAYARKSQAIAQSIGGVELELGASVPLIHAQFFVGKLEQTLASSERGLELYDPERHAPLAYLFGEDPGVMCTVYRMLCLHLVGRVDEAIEAVAAADALAARLENPISRALVLIYTGWLYQMRGEPGPTLERAERAVALTEEQALYFWGWFATLLRGWARAAGADPGAEIASMRAALAAWRQARVGVGCSAFLLWIAGVEARAGQLEAAAKTIGEARSFAERTGERHVWPEILRLEGELEARRAPRDPARGIDTLRFGLSQAESAGARTYALGCATSLARALRRVGASDESRRLLETHVASFPPDATFPDLVAARELLGTPGATSADANT